jgi:hypothetical protein
MNTTQPIANVDDKRAAHFAHFMNSMPELVQRLSWKAEQIRTQQGTALRAMQRISPMSKTDLMQNWHDIVAVPGVSISAARHALSRVNDRAYFHGDHVLVCSGGTGGIFPCPLGDGFHISEALVLIEPIDASGRPVAAAQRSDGIHGHVE